jgi:translation initiation factor IF-3
MLRVVIPAEVAAKHLGGSGGGGENGAAAATAADDQQQQSDNSSRNNRLMSRADALALARLAGLDLVEVAPHASPPVARICDWGSEAYTRGLSKEASERRARVRSRLDTPKELAFTPRIADHDMATKMRRMSGWLASGQRVAVVVRFRRNEAEAAEQAAAYLSARLCGDNPGAEAQAPAKGPRSVMVVVRPPAAAVAAAAASASKGGSGGSSSSSERGAAAAGEQTDDEDDEEDEDDDGDERDGER